MLKSKSKLMALTFSLLSIQAWAGHNPISHYFIDGNTVSPWQWAVGNAENYYVGLTPSLQGKTADGVLQVNRSDGSQALAANWNGKGDGSLFLSSNHIDLSVYEHKVAIVADYKIHYKPRRLQLSLALDCGYPCRGEVAIGKQFRSKPEGEWFTFPVPLNCFSVAGADLSKISSIYQLNTKQKLSIEIDNIRLALLPADESGCN